MIEFCLDSFILFIIIMQINFDKSFSVTLPCITEHTPLIKTLFKLLWCITFIKLKLLT